MDDKGPMNVAEAGGAFLDEPATDRILRIENEKATEVANLEAKGIEAPVAELAWHWGMLFFIKQVTSNNL